MKRLAARVVLFDDHDRVLLFFGIDPRTDEGWWFTPGGGVEGDEDLQQAALRELAEETGLLLDAADLHGPVWRRTASFSWAGSDLEQTEYFFAARTAGFAPDTSGFSALERDTVRDHRWWSAADLAVTADQVYPVELPGRLGEAIAQLSTHRVSEPVEIS